MRGLEMQIILWKTFAKIVVKYSAQKKIIINMWKVTQVQFLSVVIVERNLLASGDMGYICWKVKKWNVKIVDAKFAVVMI